jgi:hypothetical protein
MDIPTKKILISREKVIDVPVKTTNVNKQFLSQKTIFYIVIFIIIAFLLFK